MNLVLDYSVILPRFDVSLSCCYPIKLFFDNVLCNDIFNKSVGFLEISRLLLLKTLNPWLYDDSF